jgi:hypothetical protein
VIAEVASIWQDGSTAWGITWRALQILVTEKPNKMSDFAFVNDGNDDDEEIAADGDIMFADDN